MGIQSGLYTNPFFKYIFRDFPLRGIYVTQCDNQYRSICPYMDTIMDPSDAFLIFISSIFGIALLLALCLFCAWTCDQESKENNQSRAFLQKASLESPQNLDINLQKEYTKSWLEGRYMGEEG